jgi:antitoxin component of RelBE/YafQ-DinJ toxin-antitoxin module
MRVKRIQNETITLTVRVDKNLLDEVKKKADIQGLAVSQVVRYYLKKYAEEKQLEFFF